MQIKKRAWPIIDPAISQIAALKALRFAAASRDESRLGMAHFACQSK
jgi:hypothetical protein